jgi:hypothetical protein
MAVKVIIERRVPKGKDTDLANLMRDLRAKAMFARGYISGETLRAHDDPTLYVDAWYAHGGVRRTVQVLATDVLGPNGVIAVAVLLIGIGLFAFFAVLLRLA